MIIVNTASQCSFTPQYSLLESLYQKYKSQGLTVLGFPCNQFGAQEPGEDHQIKSFCETNYGVTFPIFSKLIVNGTDQHPLFQYLSSACPGLMGSKKIKWNFTKFIVDRSGLPIKRFAPTTDPLKMVPLIEDLLEKNGEKLESKS